MDFNGVIVYGVQVGEWAGVVNSRALAVGNGAHVVVPINWPLLFNVYRSTWILIAWMACSGDWIITVVEHSSATNHYVRRLRWDTHCRFIHLCVDDEDWPIPDDTHSLTTIRRDGWRVTWINRQKVIGRHTRWAEGADESLSVMSPVHEGKSMGNGVKMDRIDWGLAHKRV